MIRYLVKIYYSGKVLHRIVCPTIGHHGETILSEGRDNLESGGVLDR